MNNYFLKIVTLLVTAVIISSCKSNENKEEAAENKEEAAVYTWTCGNCGKDITAREMPPTYGCTGVLLVEGSMTKSMWGANGKKHHWINMGRSN